MDIDKNLPVYSIGVAAQLLDLHPRSLRIYEEEGLIKPHRVGGKRVFSQNDLEWIKCIREFIHEENINIKGLQKLLQLLPCWKVKDCPSEKRLSCSALKSFDKKCWELTQKSCENSCNNCPVYLAGTNK